MRKQWFLLPAVLLATVGASSTLFSAPMARTALPGTVNYVEGQASINGNPLSAKQDGNTQLEANQTLATGNGKAEILLSPGVFVRAGSNSEVRMVSPELVNPEIEVIRGQVMVEVDQKPKDVQINVRERGATASLLKHGLYDFDSDQSSIRVMDGKVKVTENDNSKEFGKGKEVVLNGEPLKPVSFDRNEKDDLYRWSKVRSDYLAQANEATAQNIYLGYGSFWGPGWYWNPYFASWSWLPGSGYLYSPFGYPFFSPGYVAYAPYYGGIGFRGGYRRGFVGRRGFAPVQNIGPRIGATGHFTGGGLRGGGGGFHGGGSGFHGGTGRR